MSETITATTRRRQPSVDLPALTMNDLTPHLGHGRPCDANWIVEFVANRLPTSEDMKQYLASVNQIRNRHWTTFYQETLKLTAKTLNLDEEELLSRAAINAKNRFLKVPEAQRSKATCHSAVPEIALPSQLQRPHVGLGDLRGSDGNVFAVRGLVTAALCEYDNDDVVVNSYTEAMDAAVDYRQGLAISALYLGLDVDSVLAQVGLISEKKTEEETTETEASI